MTVIPWPRDINCPLALKHVYRDTVDPKIRANLGESIFGYTTRQERVEYVGNPHVVGYKIDIRLLADVDGEECDLDAAELTRYDTRQKTVDDEAKLCREAKDIVDHLANLPVPDVCPTGWMLQIANCQCQLSTVHLAGDGLYVAVPQFPGVHLPKSFSDITLLQALHTMVVSMRRTADVLPSASMKEERLGERFGRGNLAAVRYEAWLRDTFYTPPQGSEPSLPDVMFKATAVDHTIKLLKAKRTDELPKVLDGVSTKGLHTDKYGWVYVPELEKYYNTATHSYEKEHPYM